MSLWMCERHGPYAGGFSCPDCGEIGDRAEIEIMRPDENGWSEWIHPMPGYIMQCCDCGLKHEMETAIVEAHDAITPAAEGEDEKHVIIFRMRRALEGDKG